MFVPFACSLHSCCQFSKIQIYESLQLVSVKCSLKLDLLTFHFWVSWQRVPPRAGQDGTNPCNQSRARAAAVHAITNTVHVMTPKVSCQEYKTQLVLVHLRSLIIIVFKRCSWPGVHVWYFNLRVGTQTMNKEQGSRVMLTNGITLLNKSETEG